MKLLLGADPEFWLTKAGENVSAHGMVEGTKENPLLLKNGAVQVDGTALEFNINPAENEEQFVEHIDTVIEQIRTMIPKDYDFDFSPVAHYTEEVFKEIPKEAKILGCEPDYNAYTGLINETPNVEATFRTAAGHVHFGYTDGVNVTNANHFKDCRILIAYVDLFVGLPLSILERTNKRNELYGKAGAFRPKSYGVEWRTGSNFWLNSEKLQRLVYKQCQKAFSSLVNNDLLANRYTNYVNVRGYIDNIYGQNRIDIDNNRKHVMNSNRILYEEELLYMCGII